MEIEPSYPTLKPLPTNADQEMPTRTGRVGEPRTPDSPKESINFAFVRSEWQGAFQLLQ